MLVAKAGFKPKSGAFGNEPRMTDGNGRQSLQERRWTGSCCVWLGVVAEAIKNAQAGRAVALGAINRDWAEMR